MAERVRQVVQEGLTVQRDVEQYHRNELIKAAYCYVLSAAGRDYLEPGEHLPRRPPEAWPWDERWWKPNEDPVRDLVKAGALIAAEIDRILAVREAS